MQHPRGSKAGVLTQHGRVIGAAFIQKPMARILLHQLLGVTLGYG